MSTPTLPDCYHIRTLDAEDLADALVKAIAAIGRPLCLYLEPDGVVGFEFFARGDAGVAGLSLVGCYDRDATAVQIREDILAMRREKIDGKAVA